MKSDNEPDRYETPEGKERLLRQVNERFAFLQDGEIMERTDYNEFKKLMNEGQKGWIA